MSLILNFIPLAPIASPDGIKRRVRQRPTLPEFAALVLVLLLPVAFVSFGISQFPDYRAFILAGEGVFGSENGGYFYAHWFLPVLSLFGLLPLPVGYVLWCWLNGFGILFAARVFGGATAWVLLCYQMLYVLYYGNIVGIIAAALALMWWALHRRQWALAGIAWAVAATKLQLGLPVGLAILLIARTDWRIRWRAVLALLCIVLASLIVYPDWVAVLWETLQTVPPDTRGNIGLWQYVGAAGLLLWLPVLWVAPSLRLVMITATLALTSPYFQQTDLLLLFVLPVGRLAILGNLGYLFIGYQWAILKILAVIPALAYGVSLYQTWLRRNRPTT